MSAERNTQVTLPDGRVETLTLDDLRRARALAPPTEGRVHIIMDGERVDLIALVEAALNVSLGTITLAQARQIARSLDLPFAPAPKARPTATAPYELRSQLARLSGRWVAIAADRVIADDETLSGLLARTENQRATIAFVPVRDPGGQQ